MESIGLKYLRHCWRIWAKALGQKASNCDRESDKVAIVRTVILLTYFVTNVAIVANAIRHWDDNSQKSCYNETAVSKTSHAKNL